MTKLSSSLLIQVDPGKVSVPPQSLLNLPEKVLQFGTGILLRGLPDYFIDKANREGLFGGRIVMVKSTDRGDSKAFREQNGLYTLYVRGIRGNAEIREQIILSAVSRVLSASGEWNEVLKCAADPHITVVISNTTEVGIVYEEESVLLTPPNSYPGKLLACLWERFRKLGGRPGTGWIVVPTELVTGNGNLLREIIFRLADFNKLPGDFIRWMKKEIQFCNSLVDRIVTGMPQQSERNSVEKELGYEDDLLTMCEPYRLWAIEGDEKIRRTLSFAAADPGLVVAPDIELYRELKLRVLNGTHTLSCGLAYLGGWDTVQKATRDMYMGRFMEKLMNEEIGPSIPYTIEPSVLKDYMKEVMDRFGNPYLRHQWIKITLNFSSKMKMRCIPLLEQYYKNHGKNPPLLTFGFAAYLQFMKAVKKESEKYYGICRDEFYPIDDFRAELFFEWWQSGPVTQWLDKMLKDQDLWGADLSKFEGFREALAENLHSIERIGMKETLKQIISQ